MSARPLPGLGIAGRLLVSAVVAGLAAVVAGHGTFAAFTAESSNQGNSVATGTVRIADDDAGSAMFSLTEMHPDDAPVSRCVLVTYEGSLDATVRLYASTTGALAPYLNLTVTRGTGGSSSSCASFAPDATDYLGQGPGVIYAGTLGGFPATYGGGVVDPAAASPETWSTSEAHAYRFTVSVQDDPAAEGTSATAEFVWEGRNA